MPSQLAWKMAIDACSQGKANMKRRIGDSPGRHSSMQPTTSTATDSSAKIRLGPMPPIRKMATAMGNVAGGNSNPRADWRRREDRARGGRGNSSMRCRDPVGRGANARHRRLEAVGPRQRRNGRGRWRRRDKITDRVGECLRIARRKRAPDVAVRGRDRGRSRRSPETMIGRPQASASLATSPQLSRPSEGSTRQSAAA